MTLIRSAVCVSCGGSFDCVDGLHHLRGGRPRLYCSPTCRSAAVGRDVRGRVVERESVCRACGSAFVERRVTKSGMPQWYCSPSCQVDTQRKKAAARRDAKRELQLSVPQTCSACGVEFFAPRMKVHCGARSCKRLSERASSYGIGASGYRELLEAQGGCCALCGDPFGDEIPRIDHCHASNRVRGLLHLKCNVALGHLNDSVERALMAAEYLRRTAV